MRATSITTFKQPVKKIGLLAGIVSFITSIPKGMTSAIAITRRVNEITLLMVILQKRGVPRALRLVDSPKDIMFLSKFP